MQQITEDALRAVRDRESLFAFLADALKWPVTPDDTLTYPLDIPGDPKLDAEVTQIVPFTSGDPYAIFLMESADGLRRSHLREALRQVRGYLKRTGRYAEQPVEKLVFICAPKDYQQIRFAHFEPREGKQPKLSVFGWDRDDQQGTRTLRDTSLPALRMPPRNHLGEPDWAQVKWSEAWDVEKVTREFFKRYKQVFEEFLLRIEGIADERERWFFGQQLFNRIMFCWFLQKKGWLNRQHDYLRSLWRVAEDHAHTRPRGASPSFYADLLHPLFFRALNVPPDERPDDEDHERLMALLGDVPFLNGGLFDPRSQYDQPGAVKIPNEAFDPLFTLFEDYRFTIDESTPDDIDVAVDPEMLGKVFEELVTGRHESGSYYTPRPVVSFMCREALKGYLADACPGETPETVAAWVEGDDSRAAELRNPEAVLDALKRVTVCDPACGSGAYLLGMMQELLRLRQSLFAAKVADHKLVHDRKLEIIQRNLYGVDIDPFATNVAMLRLWLSLVVDDQRDPLDGHTDVSLPNLRFKIQTGDSLLAPAPDPGALTLHAEAYADAAMRMRALHDEYFSTRTDGQGRPKAQIEADIAATQIEIEELLGTQARAGSVHWEVSFAEAFAGNSAGFDIVLANPPYVRQELISEQKPALKNGYGDLFCGTADLYTYFYLRGLQILRPGGMLAYISSNKWFRAAYGEKLRKHVAETCRVVSITDFGELPVFESAATFPMIFIAAKGASTDPPLFTQVKTLDPPYPDVAAIIREQGKPLPPGALAGGRWTLTDKATADRLAKMERAGVPLGEYVQGRIYRGVLTGFNQAFVIDGAKRAELIAHDPRSAEIIKPLAMGDDIRRWRIRDRDRWLIVTRVGVDMERYPAVMAHLARWQPQLEKRWDKGDHWWELRACAYYEEFEKPKIVYQEIATFQRFAYDEAGTYVNNKVFLIPTDDLYLLGLLNSAPVWEYLGLRCGRMIGGACALQAVHVSQVPVPDAPDAERAAIARLAQCCIDAGGVGCEVWEREIDERVAALYGL